MLNRIGSSIAAQHTAASARNSFVSWRNRLEALTDRSMRSEQELSRPTVTAMFRQQSPIRPSHSFRFVDNIDNVPPDSR